MMTKHLIDHAKKRGDMTRLKHFLRVEKADHPSDATKQLQRRSRALSDSSRVKAYTRIEREG